MARWPLLPLFALSSLCACSGSTPSDLIVVTANASQDAGSGVETIDSGIALGDDGGKPTGQVDSGSSPPPSSDAGSSPKLCREPNDAVATNAGPADLFPCDSPWIQDVSASPAAAESTEIVSAIRWGNGGRFEIDFSFHWMVASDSSPKLSFTGGYEPDSDTGPVPVPAGGALEGETDYTCRSGGDCHLLVVDPKAKKLFELYNVDVAGRTAEAQATWDLTKRYGPEGRGYGCTSADAAGLPILPGLIGLAETRAGEIRHALRFILPNSRIRGGISYVAPATHGTSATSSTAGPPYGTRLRLKASFDASRIATRGGRAIVAALKRYGMILADGGEIALTAQSDFLEKRSDPKATWQGLLGARDLASLAPTDFEVVDFGSVRENGQDCQPANR